MKTTDWNFDFSTLPRYDARDRIPYVFDEFFEISPSDMLCCIYSIAEVSMMNYVGHLAILKDKSAPKLWLNVWDGFCFCNNFSASADGDLIFLQPSISKEISTPDGVTQKIKRPILIIDLVKNAFSYVDTKNHNPCYKVVKVDKNVFAVEADENQKKSDKHLSALCQKKIYTDKLKWHHLSLIDSLPEMVFI